MAYNQKKADKERALAKREVIDAYKLSVGCVDCGYKENAKALEFDHKPGTKGKYTVASMMYQSWASIWAEIAKCDVRCANCHAIRTLA